MNILTAILLAGSYLSPCIQSQMNVNQVFRQGYEIETYTFHADSTYQLNRAWFTDEKCTQAQVADPSFDQESGSFTISNVVGGPFTMAGTQEVDFQTIEGPSTGFDRGAILPEFSNDEVSQVLSIRIARGMKNATLESAMLNTFVSASPYLRK